ncbi:MAG: hypothetical protein M0036_26940 [Desulfobacteraceae bacterium]|nr:hypothetical protein [Desulfobacteraceae bacterium]
MRKARKWSAFVLPVMGFAMLAALGACVKSQVNTDSHGWAVKGYDVVAYFTQGKPTRGADQYTYQWQSKYIHGTALDSCSIITAQGQT